MPDSEHTDHLPSEKVSHCVLGSLLSELCVWCRNGVLRFEPVQQLRHQLDRLGRMTGLTQEERGHSLFVCVVQ